MSEQNLKQHSIVPPHERLLSLWQAAHRTRIAPTSDALLDWAAQVVVASMGYYIAELDDPGLDPDCPLCAAMIELGSTLGGLVVPPKGMEYREWKKGLSRRLNRLGLKMPQKINEKWDLNERQAAG